MTVLARKNMLPTFGLYLIKFTKFLKERAYNFNNFKKEKQYEQLHSWLLQCQNERKFRSFKGY